MNKIIKNSNDPAMVKLSKIHYTVILTLGFGQCTGTATKVVVICDSMKEEITRGQKKKPFWRQIDEELADEDVVTWEKRETSGDGEGGGKNIEMLNAVNQEGIVNGNQEMAEMNDNN